MKPPEVQRQAHMDRIQTYLDKPPVKVITGMRRAGKSTLLAQTREAHLARGIPDAQILLVFSRTS